MKKILPPIGAIVGLVIMGASYPQGGGLIEVSPAGPAALRLAALNQGGLIGILSLTGMLFSRPCA
jgi:hypothetical protein